jgi:hypothetical protein
VARVGENRNVLRKLAGKIAGKRTLERPSNRWENNINIYLKNIRRKARIKFLCLSDKWRILAKAVINLRVL